MLDVCAEPRRKGGLIEGSGGEAQDGLCGGFFRGCETITVHFEKEDADEEAGAFVAIEEGVVADNTEGVGGSHVDDVRVVLVGVKLLGPGECGLKQAKVAHTCGAAVEGEKAAVEREGVGLVNPSRFTHVAS